MVLACSKRSDSGERCGVEKAMIHPDLPYDELTNIRNIFPDTPVKMLKEVLEALQLFDFAELLEKATKPRTLRPALPLKEIEKLSNVSNRPTKVYSKAEVLIIEFCEGPSTAANNDRNDAERVGSFFKALNSQNEITTLTSNHLKKSLVELDYLVKVKQEEETVDRREGEREKYQRHFSRTEERETDIFNICPMRVNLRLRKEKQE